MVKFGFGNIMQGVLGNMSTQSKEDLEQEYGKYRFEGEAIETGYQLIRDAIVFTNERILFVDKQGTIGKNTSFKSIYHMTIVDVLMETAGFGFDDSEITITYMMNVKRKAHAESLEKRKFDFPKTIDILPLFKYLGTLALNNRKEINVGE